MCTNILVRFATCTVLSRCHTEMAENAFVNPSRAYSGGGMYTHTTLCSSGVHVMEVRAVCVCYGICMIGEF